MKNEYLILLLISSILACSIYPAWGQENTTPEITFACKENNGTPITIIKDKQGKSKNIFHYQKNTLPSFVNSQQLCHDVAERFNNYYREEGYFQLTYSREINFFTDLQSDRVLVCASLELPNQFSRIDCRANLFSFSNQEISQDCLNEILESILDPKIVSDRHKRISRNRTRVCSWVCKNAYPFDLHYLDINYPPLPSPKHIK